MPFNGLANLRQVSGAKVAVASFVTDAARRQAQRFVRRQLMVPFSTLLMSTSFIKEKSNNEEYSDNYRTYSYGSLA